MWVVGLICVEIWGLMLSKGDLTGAKERKGIRGLLTLSNGDKGATRYKQAGN
jgi:hypothetical protein